MSEWKTSKLSEVIEIIGGGTPKRSKPEYWNGDIPWLSVADFNNDLRYVSSSLETITELGLRKSSTKLLNEGQLIISARGTVGCLAQLSVPMAFNQSCYGLCGKDGVIDNGFLYYSLKTKISELKQKTHGAVFDTITRDTFEHINISYPTIAEQREIAKRLGDLDDKIHLNTQTNQTLEHIAQAIYKSWFVDYEPTRAKAAVLAASGSMADAETAAMTAISGKSAADLAALAQNHPARYQQLVTLAAAFPATLVPTDNFGEIPEGWEAATLGEICDMKNGYAFKSADWTESGIPVIKIGSVKPMLVEVEGNGFVDASFATSKPEFLVQSGDILVGLTGYVGEVGRMPHDRNAMLNQRVAKFVPKKIDSTHTYYNFVYCLARQETFKRFAEGNAKGSAQANISTKELLKYPVVIADSTIHKAFESFTAALMEKILLNSSNSWQLANARDLLLPKILNGGL